MVFCHAVLELAQDGVSPPCCARISSELAKLKERRLPWLLARCSQQHRIQMKRERKNCKQPGVKGVVVVKTLVKTLWFLKRLVYHMKDILLWNKGSPYLSTERRQNSVQQAFPSKEQDRSFPCGKVATLWLTVSSHNSKISVWCTYWIYIPQQTSGLKRHTDQIPTASAPVTPSPENDLSSAT